MEANEPQLEQLERAVLEIEALEAIYGYEDDGFTVHSESELLAARAALERGPAAGGTAWQLEIELKINLDEVENEPWARLRCRLPPGYPDAAVTVSVSIAGLGRAAADRLSAQLTERAVALVGNEAVVELVQHLQEIAPIAIEAAAVGQQTKNNDEAAAAGAAVVPVEETGRRWIWVHHIKDPERRKSIVVEAQGLGLGGYLKCGYPGIIVVEGDVDACEKFVKWVKGSKSSPNGFGRNWGHHVRGQSNTPDRVRLLPTVFEDLGEDMGNLGTACSRHGLDDEFREYILQHKSTARVVASREEMND